MVFIFMQPGSHPKPCGCVLPGSSDQHGPKLQQQSSTTSGEVGAGKREAGAWWKYCRLQRRSRLMILDLLRSTFFVSLHRSFGFSKYSTVCGTLHAMRNWEETCWCSPKPVLFHNSNTEWPREVDWHFHLTTTNSNSFQTPQFFRHECDSRSGISFYGLLQCFRQWVLVSFVGLG